MDKFEIKNTDFFKLALDISKNWKALNKEKTHLPLIYYNISRRIQGNLAYCQNVPFEQFSVKVRRVEGHHLFAQ